MKNAAIKEGIFGMLESSCTVLYYSIDDVNCGFHVKKIVGDRLEDFVYINTNKAVEIQIFTAAHELGHIWQVAEKVYEKIESKNIDDEELLEVYRKTMLLQLSLAVIIML